MEVGEMPFAQGNAGNLTIADVERPSRPYLN